MLWTLYVRALIGLTASMAVIPDVPNPEVTSVEQSIVGHLDFDPAEPSTWWPGATKEERELLILVYVEEEINIRILREEYNFSDDVIEDIMYVHLNTSVDPLVLGSIVNRESCGRRGAINYCKVWGPAVYNEKKERWEKRCAERGRCYEGCRKDRSIWKNHLDVGLWQLRDVIERVGGPENSRRFAGWSWLRSYNTTLPKGEKVESDCALDRFCSREAMVHAVWSLMEEQVRLVERGVRGKADCRGLPENLKWLGLWNGCRSARNHTRRAMALMERRQFMVQIGVFYHNFRLATDDWPVIGDFPHIIFSDAQSV